MALNAGKNPAAIPTNTAKPMAVKESQGGILERSPGIFDIKCPERNLLIRNETP